MNGLYEPDDRHSIAITTAANAAGYDRPFMNLSLVSFPLTGIEKTTPAIRAVILRGLRRLHEKHIVDSDRSCKHVNISFIMRPKSLKESHLKSTKPIITTKIKIDM